MALFPNSLHEKLSSRKKTNSLRTLEVHQSGVDFFSNDYLGFAKNETIAQRTLEILSSQTHVLGSTGSRLISGTHDLHLRVEQMISEYHFSQAALLFNSGYDANLGLFSSILQKGDIVLYDELIHASVRDGIRLGTAKAYKFKHNDCQDIESKIVRFKERANTIYLAIESVYSMDGDTAPIRQIAEICERYQVRLIVDEAHSTGVFGEKGRGLVCELNLEQYIFARVHTFGKAMGCHGAVVLGSSELRTYLINFSRAFIYTTAISLHSVANIMAAYEVLAHDNAFLKFKENVTYFKSTLIKLNLEKSFIHSDSAIQCCVIPGNYNVKEKANFLQNKKFSIKPILSPTVPEGAERLRICLHAFNSKLEIQALISNIKLCMN